MTKQMPGEMLASSNRLGAAKYHSWHRRSLFCLWWNKVHSWSGSHCIMPSRLFCAPFQFYWILYLFLQMLNVKISGHKFSQFLKQEPYTWKFHFRFVATLLEYLLWFEKVYDSDLKINLDYFLSPMHTNICPYTH